MKHLHAFTLAGAQLAACCCRGRRAQPVKRPFWRFRPGGAVDRVAVPGGAGEVALTQRAPPANAWLLLSLPAADGRGTRSHLENADPQRQRITPDAAAPGSLLISRRRCGLGAQRCVLWPGAALAQASRRSCPTCRCAAAASTCAMR